MTKRRALTTAFKKKAALAAHYQVHPNQISQWKKQAIEGLDGVFDSKRANRTRDVDGEIKELHAKIGELTMVNSFLEDGLRK
jgi:transposase